MSRSLSLLLSVWMFVFSFQFYVIIPTWSQCNWMLSKNIADNFTIIYVFYEEKVLKQVFFSSFHFQKWHLIDQQTARVDSLDDTEDGLKHYWLNLIGVEKQARMVRQKIAH